MAESKLTKHALAKALRELMEEMPFEKINVGQICEKCGMNRKSFYYHFKDKYDLVNWIFDVDFYELVQAEPQERWAFVERLCTYLDENRTFYQKVMPYRGQNAFQDHLRETMLPLLRTRLGKLMGGLDVDPICMNFLVSGVMGCMEYLIMEGGNIPPETFVASLKSMLEGFAKTYASDPNILMN